MSEKRRRQQQRRLRRKAAGRSGSVPSGLRQGAARDAELDELMASMAAIAARDADRPCTALEAEEWASCLVGTWHLGELPDRAVEDLFVPGFVQALERLGTAHALATLRAMSAVGAGAHGPLARSAADRLTARGLPEPSWSEALGRARPTAAALICDQAFDDGVSVLVGFAAPDGEAQTLGIYIDHNMGGIVKGVFLAGPLGDVRAELGGRAPDGIAIRELDLAEARGRVEAALDILDHTHDPRVDDGVRALRALIEARMRLLPAGFTVPDDFEEVTPEACDELLSDFLASTEGRRWRGDEVAEDVAGTAIDFGAVYNHGGPLRWSPVVVEIYMTSWLARKVAREPEFFARVPEVLRDWVAYAGRRRGVPAASLREAVAAVKHNRREMVAAVTDPQAWGPAKTFAVAAEQAGVDLTDPDAVGRFLEGYTAGLAA
ncbi:MAG TPA: hypothetical protein VKA57_10530 [Solirubrobacteraceae bacterium]|nr:hypothetical protein [Solirubrobacteraceae bacterium]